MNPRIRHDPGCAARLGPERPQVIRTQPPVPFAIRKYPIPGRRSGEAMQQCPRGFAKQNVPRSSLRVNQGEPVRLDLTSVHR